MRRGRASPISKFSEALESLYQPVLDTEFPEHLFGIVSKLLSEVMLSFDMVCGRTGTLHHARNFEPPRPLEWLERLVLNLEKDHPGVGYVHGGGAERLLRLSDFLSQRQLRDTALYQENYKETGIRHQVVVVLPLPGKVAGLAINRSVDFSDGEVALIRLLGPHIVRAHANAELFSALRRSGVSISGKPNEKFEAAELTLREREVFYWLAQGKRDREVAIILGASYRTVHKHVQRILAKLGAETRSAAIASVFER